MLRILHRHVYLFLIAALLVVAAGVSMTGTAQAVPSGESGPVIKLKFAAPGGPLAPVPMALVHSFGDVYVGSSSVEWVVEAENGELSPLELGTLTITGDFTLTTDNCSGVTLQPNEYCAIGITFSPLSAGYQIGTVTFPYVGGGGTSVEVEGTGIDPQITISDPTVDFGDQLVGTSSLPYTVTIFNYGTSDLSLGTLNLVGSEFSLSNDNCSGATVSPMPASPCTFDLTFSPTSAGSKNGSISFSSNDQSSPHSIPISGNGIQPDLVITKTNDVSGSVLYPGGWTWTVRATNNGNADAIFQADTTVFSDNLPSSGLNYALNFPSWGGGTSISSMTASLDQSKNLSISMNGTIPPGGWIETSVVVTPTAPGTYANPRAGGSCTADPNNSIAESNESNNTCSDTVVSTAPSVSLSTSSLNFGSQPVGVASAPQTVTLTNTGNADLHIGVLSFTSDWILSNDTCSNATVTPGNNCTFDVAFNPLALGPLTGSVSIPSDAASSPDEVSLSGNGSAPFSTTFTSLGTYDGNIFETTEFSGLGGTPNISGGFLDIGDMVMDRQILSLLHFDTSSLPDGAQILSLTLQLKRYQFVGTDPFTLLGNLNVDIASPYFGAEMALRAGDFQASPSQDNVGIFNPTPLTGNWYESNLGASAFPYLNLTGATQFRLHFTLDDNDDLQNDFIRFFSGNAPIAGYRPVLIVEYYVP